MSYTGVMTLTWHFCEHTKTWVGGAVEDCTFHKRLDKKRPPVTGANTLGKGTK